MAFLFDDIVEKFNPYHGRDGRFTTPGSAASFTYAPGKSRAHDLAIAREKERTAAEISNPTNDPEVIAGKPRGVPMTHEQADRSRANPKYTNLNELYAKINELDKQMVAAYRNNAPAKEKRKIEADYAAACKDYESARVSGRQYRENCNNCVIAYEARRRGYDVEAQPHKFRDKQQDATYRKVCRDGGFKDPVTGRKVKEIVNDAAVRTSKQVENWLDENTEDGGRYTFEHGWKGTNGRSGHIIIAEKSGGKVKLFDPQSGENFSGDRVTEYLGRVRATYNDGRKTTGRLGLVRIDTAQLNGAVLNDALRGAGE